MGLERCCVQAQGCLGSPPKPPQRRGPTPSHQAWPSRAMRWRPPAAGRCSRVGMGRSATPSAGPARRSMPAATWRWLGTSPTAPRLRSPSSFEAPFRFDQARRREARVCVAVKLATRIARRFQPMFGWVSIVMGKSVEFTSPSLHATLLSERSGPGLVQLLEGGGAHFAGSRRRWPEAASLWRDGCGRSRQHCPGRTVRGQHATICPLGGGLATIRRGSTSSTCVGAPDVRLIVGELVGKRFHLEQSLAVGHGAKLSVATSAAHQRACICSLPLHQPYFHCSCWSTKKINDYQPLLISKALSVISQSETGDLSEVSATSFDQIRIYCLPNLCKQRVPACCQRPHERQDRGKSSNGRGFFLSAVRIVFSVKSSALHESFSPQQYCLNPITLKLLHLLSQVMFLGPFEIHQKPGVQSDLGFREAPFDTHVGLRVEGCR